MILRKASRKILSKILSKTFNSKIFSSKLTRKKYINNILFSFKIIILVIEKNVINIFNTLIIKLRLIIKSRKTLISLLKFNELRFKTFIMKFFVFL